MPRAFVSNAKKRRRDSPMSFAWRSLAGLSHLWWGMDSLRGHPANPDIV
jgi:hypothetical protein